MALKTGVFAGLLALNLAGSAACVQPAAPSGEDAGAIAGIENKVEKYALLISGKSASRHVLNMSLAYNFLLEQGFENRNIHVFDEAGQERYYLYPVDGEASRENIKKAFDSLRQRIDGNDLLFVYVSDHGGREMIQDKEVSTIKLPMGDLNQVEFLQYLEGISPGAGLFVFDPCYSGGFAKAAGRGNLVAVASTSADSKTFIDSEYDSAGAHFMLAFKNREQSDANNDGRVSLQEAFDYMQQKHSSTIKAEQQPEMYSDLSPEGVYFFD